MNTHQTPPLCIEFNAGERTSVSHEPPSYIRSLAPRQFRAETHVTGGKGWAAIGWYIFRTILMRRPDIVVSTEYRRSFLVNLALLLSRSKAQHLVLGMNLSARPITSRRAMLQRVIDLCIATIILNLIDSLFVSREASPCGRRGNPGSKSSPANQKAISEMGPSDVPYVAV